MMARTVQWLSIGSLCMAFFHLDGICCCLLILLEAVLPSEFDAKHYAAMKCSCCALLCSRLPVLLLYLDLLWLGSASKPEDAWAKEEKEGRLSLALISPLFAAFSWLVQSLSRIHNKEILHSEFRNNFQRKNYRHCWNWKPVFLLKLMGWQRRVLRGFVGDWGSATAEGQGS